MAQPKGEGISGFQLDARYSAAFMPALPGRPGESGKLWQTSRPRFDRNNTPRVIAGGSEYSGVLPDLQRHSAAFMPALPGRPGESGPLGQTLPPRFERQTGDTSPERVIAGGSEYSGVLPDLQRHSAAFTPEQGAALASRGRGAGIKAYQTFIVHNIGSEAGVATNAPVKDSVSHMTSNAPVQSSNEGWTPEDAALLSSIGIDAGSIFPTTDRPILGVKKFEIGDGVYEAFLEDGSEFAPVEGAMPVTEPLSGNSEIKVLFTVGPHRESLTSLLGGAIGEEWQHTGRRVLGSNETEKDGRRVTEIYLSHQPGQTMPEDGEKVDVPLSGTPEVKVAFQELPGAVLTKQLQTV